MAFNRFWLIFFFLACFFQPHMGYDCLINTIVNQFGGGKDSEISVTETKVLKLNPKDNEATSKTEIHVNYDRPLDCKDIQQAFVRIAHSLDNFHGRMLRATRRDALYNQRLYGGQDRILVWLVPGTMILLFAFAVHEVRKILKATTKEAPVTSHEMREILNEILDTKLEHKYDDRVEKYREVYGTGEDTEYERIHSFDEILDHIHRVADGMDLDSEYAHLVTPEFIERLAQDCFRDLSINMRLNYLTPEVLASLASHANHLSGMNGPEEVNVNFHVAVRAE